MMDITISVSAERFSQGMTFPEYLDFIATPANLAREASGGGKRADQSGKLRDWYENRPLAVHQVEAIHSLMTLPEAPSRMLVIAEEWSSDCRRDLPMFARFAEAGGLELRIFARDGQRFSGSPEPSPAESPNADLMAQFLNRKAGGPFQSLPVAAFFTDGMRYLYHYTEYPAIYEKDRVRGVMETPKPGETPEQTAARWPAEFAAFQESPFFQVVAEAAADEMIMALHRRLFIGAV